MVPYLVEEYDECNLDIHFCNKYGSDKIKFQLIAFKTYLKDIKAKTIVIENHYTSQSYLDDYLGYYAMAHHQYEKKCKRLHFFNIDFTESEFETYLSGNSNIIPLNNDAYLGYVVIKPIPEVFIGATLLRTYPYSQTVMRNYNSIRPYNINLFGLEFSLKTLIFQEQDKNVSSCATASLWYAFHYLSHEYNLPKLSLLEITRIAGHKYYADGRIFPSTGLDMIQVGKTIVSLGLIYELRNSDKLSEELEIVKAFIYAYNRGGFPVLMGLNILEKGYHLITLVGYEEVQSNKQLSQNTNFRANHLKKFYAHDEHTCPFARIYISDFNNTSDQNEILDFKKYLASCNNESKRNLQTSKFQVKINYTYSENEILSEYCLLTNLVIPLPPEIRIKFEDVQKEIKLIDTFFEAVFKSNIVWDIFIDKSNKYKVEARKNTKLNKEQKNIILFEALPKFVWIARGLINNEVVIEMVLDSTDMNMQFICQIFIILDVDKRKSFLNAIQEQNDLPWKLKAYVDLLNKY
jgi:hypothetical protein